MKLKMALDSPCFMPAVCSACGADATGSPYSRKSTGSDLEGKHYVTLTFPLCEDCGTISERVKETGFFRRRKQPNADELKAEHKALKRRASEVARAAAVSGIHYSAFGHGSMKVKLENEEFARAFAAANGLGIAA